LLRARRPAVILDFSPRLPYAFRRTKRTPGYRIDLDKEQESWRLITSLPTPPRLKFLDLGGRNGELRYLLEGNLALGRRLSDSAQRKAWFAKHVEYWNADLEGPAGGRFLTLDVCAPFTMWPCNAKEHCGTFDVVYSNNVFEHLAEPWQAAENIVRLLKPGGLAITIAPFSLRYHEAPGDYFRYTHAGIEHLFSRTGQMATVSLGYDIRARRVNWQGEGDGNDICPEDRFGAWRENWFVFHAAEKTHAGHLS